ncbi:calpain-5-like isoform X2 [Tubulanus polymorphus]|uniref:calpain-5-like isoform X2 n=1 Tax=Tubulanus polymorphus TaxID=672921 RepID=UPI003DA64316
MVKQFQNQSFGSIRKEAAGKGELWVDPLFPPNSKSLFFSKVDREIEWKRPGELCKCPQLVVNGVSTEDLNEGELGNGWFVAACSSLAREPNMWNKVIVDYKGQEWSEKNTYAGVFHFAFWRYGEWIDVVVDDLLPTKDGELIFCHSKSKSEFWSALLEKAYAKLYGDYEHLKTGFIADALVDFTGGVAEKIDLSKKDLQENDEHKYLFFNDLMSSVDNHSLAVAYIDCATNEAGKEHGQGLIKGRGYNVTSVKTIRPPANLGIPTTNMIRLNYPWGESLWTGPWCEKSEEWQKLPMNERSKLGMKFATECEFWMTFDDFLANFTHIEICHIVNTSIFSLKKTWHEKVFTGKWSKGSREAGKDRSGGSDKHETFLNNPQYVFDVTSLRDTIMVSLEQNDIRADRMEAEINKIGFSIIKVEENRKFRVHGVDEKVMTSEYTKSRNIFQKVGLTKGRYVVIPTTEEPGIVGDYLLRIYTSQGSGAGDGPKNCGGSILSISSFIDKFVESPGEWLHPSVMDNVTELSKEYPKPFLPCFPNHRMVTQVTVVQATDLAKSDNPKETVDPFVVIKGEGDSVKGIVAENTTNPVWNTRGVFYRKKPDDKPIIIEVWNKQRMINDFMGMCEVATLGNEEGVTEKIPLTGKGSESEVAKPGILTIIVKSSTDLEYF